jgi:DNA-binding XRE family transcriptional regulator
LAAVVGVSRKTINTVEKPPATLAPALAEALGTRVEEIVHLGPQREE